MTTSTRSLDADGLVVGHADTIYTYTGRMIRPLDPNPDDIVIEDIAHALAHSNRWTGHLSRAVSVAEHSVRVARLVPDDLKLEALLHDASEAYLSDIARPVKKAPGFDMYLRFEAQLENAVARAFNLPPRPSMDPTIKKADQYILEAEAAQFGSEPLKVAMGVTQWDDSEGKPWKVGVLPQGWSARLAKEEFLDDFWLYWDRREEQKEARL